VAQPLREKPGSLPPRQLGSPPVVLAVLVVLEAVVVALLVAPPAPFVLESPPLPPVVVVPPAPEVVVSELPEPPLPEPPVVAPLVPAEVLTVTLDALLEVPVVAFEVAFEPLVFAAAVVRLPPLVAVVAPPLVLATSSDVESPPAPSVPPPQAVRHATSHELTQRTSGRVCLTMVAQMLGSGASITKSTSEKSSDSRRAPSRLFGRARCTQRRSQARASSTMLNGVSVARRTWLNPASRRIASKRAWPACAPSV
jgi:hypothetical protein